MYGDRVITLHGGPMHGRQMQIPTGLDHIHVAAPAKLNAALFREMLEHPTQAVEMAEVKQGIYSQVTHQGYHSDFEWDGWLNHDHG